MRGEEKPSLCSDGPPECREAHAPVGIDSASPTTHEQRTLCEIGKAIALICGISVHAKTGLWAEWGSNAVWLVQPLVLFFKSEIGLGCAGREPQHSAFVTRFRLRRPGKDLSQRPIGLRLERKAVCIRNALRTLPWHPCELSARQ